MTTFNSTNLSNPQSPSMKEAAQPNTPLLLDSGIEPPLGSPRLDAFRKVLWVALLVNLSMFLVEMFFGFTAQSSALMADALDFLGDGLGFGLSLFVLTGTLALRAKVALYKGYLMAAFSLGILVLAIANFQLGALPNETTMISIAVLALLANLTVGVLLFQFRQEDANALAVWLCTRNDAIGNLLVLVSGVVVLFTQSAWPDLIAALVLACVGLFSAKKIIKRAKEDLNK